MDLGTTNKKYCITINGQFNESKLLKGSWIVLVNAKRTPPHVGMIFNGKYNSLNINGQELDINVLALLKRIEIQKIKAVFIQLKQHPVFSLDYLMEHFKIQVQKYPRVDNHVATCFTPVKNFFIENYALIESDIEYLYHLFPELHSHEVIAESFALNLDKQDMDKKNIFYIPVYTKQTIEDKLNHIHSEYHI